VETGPAPKTIDAPHGRNWRRPLLGSALVLACALALLPLWLEGRQAPRHVFVFVFDALRADHLSQYGYPRDTSPGLEELAQASTLFESAYAPSSYTTASTASLFTGLSPARHGASRQGTRLDDAHETIAEVLGTQGYAARGLSFNPVVAHSTGFTQGFADFVEREKGSPFNLYPDIAEGLTRIRGWLDQHPEQQQLVYFQVMNTHGPYLVPESARTTLLGRAPEDDFQYYRAPMGDILAGDIGQRSAVTSHYVESAIERYDTAIRYATDQLGDFLEELRVRGLYDDALIVVTADHGDEFFEHGGFSHGYTLHEEVVRVPLLVKLPGQAQGRRVAQRVALMDVFPTLADAVGAAIPTDLDGRSLLPLLARDATPERESDARNPLHLSVEFPPRLIGRGLIEGRHKLIAIESNYEGAERELRLYDLHTDPGERQNLASRQPEIAQSMLTRLMAHARQEQQRAAPPAAAVDELDREHLRALGYVE
jgi:arylsulfatase A-like enzyme